jgi:hypothetical protein
MGLAAAVLLVPDAVQGVRDRFEGDPAETMSRFASAIQYVPPLALVFVDHPPLGMGTGALQNAANLRGELSPYVVENEHGRVLIELGVPGYLLMSAVRVGLIVALLRAGWFLRARGKRPAAGAAFALAALTLPGNLLFDHVFQALYFIGVGIVLEATVREDAARPRS